MNKIIKITEDFINCNLKKKEDILDFFSKERYFKEYEEFYKQNLKTISLLIDWEFGSIGFDLGLTYTNYYTFLGKERPLLRDFYEEQLDLEELAEDFFEKYDAIILPLNDNKKVVLNCKDISIRIHSDSGNSIIIENIRAIVIDITNHCCGFVNSNNQITMFKNNLYYVEFLDLNID